MRTRIALAAPLALGLLAAAWMLTRSSDAVGGLDPGATATDSIESRQDPAPKLVEPSESSGSRSDAEPLELVNHDLEWVRQLTPREAFEVVHDLPDGIDTETREALADRAAMAEATCPPEDWWQTHKQVIHEYAVPNLSHLEEHRASSILSALSDDIRRLDSLADRACVDAATWMQVDWERGNFTKNGRSAKSEYQAPARERRHTKTRFFNRKTSVSVLDWRYTYAFDPGHYPELVATLDQIDQLKESMAMTVVEMNR